MSSYFIYGQLNEVSLSLNVILILFSNWLINYELKNLLSRSYVLGERQRRFLISPDLMKTFIVNYNFICNSTS